VVCGLKLQPYRHQNRLPSWRLHVVPWRSLRCDTAPGLHVLPALCRAYGWALAAFLLS
jgi:hypothetical protein